MLWTFGEGRSSAGVKGTGGEDRRLALLHDVFRTARGVGWIDVNYMADKEPVEQHAEHRQVLFDDRRRQFGLQVLDESGNMERLDIGKLIDVFKTAPGRKAARGVHRGAAARGWWKSYFFKGD
jgi:hypothetical protein